MPEVGRPLGFFVLVEVWSDVVCPWCYVGKTRFEAALERLPWRDEIDVRYRPFELDPNVPPGGVDLAEYLRRKFGSAASVEAIEGRVGEAGGALGLTFDWDKVRRVNTFDAHRLLAWAFESSGPGAQARLKHGLMQGYFGGADVSDRDVLAQIAGEAGLDVGEAAGVIDTDRFADVVRDGEREAAELDIHAVPTFVVERRLAIPGAQEPDTFVLLLDRARERFRPPSPAVE